LTDRPNSYPGEKKEYECQSSPQKQRLDQVFLQ